jgi:signal transduction histidine kinase/ActR/RegA family two-component response regulator
MTDDDRVNILMVDDQPGKLLSYEAILSGLGENLVKASSAREALDFLLKVDVAVVLLDVSMPELDGFELAAMIRQHPRFEKTAIIFISAVLMTEFDRLRGYESGAVDYIPVPVVPELLRAKVRVFVDLYRKTRQLERLNDELEERVAQRTAELEASTARLRDSEETLERLLEQETAARAEAQAANRAKDEFLALISHELRTPLNAILGWNTILKSMPDAAIRYRAIETIERNGKHQLRLIEDLMDTARIIGGKLRLEMQPVELAGVVFAAFDAVRAAAEAKRIALLPDFQLDFIQISGDPDRLQQIVWNLLSNAIKFTSEGGVVTVGLRYEEPHVCLEVCDTGRGIDPDFLPYVFDRFRQADASASRRFGGLGLGLALVRHLVEMHGGTVEAASDGEGKGAIFRVRLPAAVVQPLQSERRPPRSADRSAAGGDPQLSGVRVLVVDDEPDARDLVATSLGRYGAEVVTVGSGREALDAIARRDGDAPFDVLVSDIGMPEMDGYMLIERIRKLDDAVSSVPAIAVTAYSREEDRDHALACGFQAHVSKPVDMAQLAAIIGSLLGSTGTALAV